jgi:sRNA-binding carbon storage regulator CsrA
VSVLVLQRNIDGEILIGSGSRMIRVVVLDAGPGWAKVGIDAPRDVAVDRAEVRRRKETEGVRCGPNGSNYPPG